MQCPIRIKIFDADTNRLMIAMKSMEAVIAEYELDAQVTVIDEHLEISRAGLGKNLPALELNGRILLTGQAVTKEVLLKLFKPLKGYTFKSTTIKEKK